jgi:hypothetical protein
MTDKLLIVPLGYGWARDLRGCIIADAQGEERIKKAIMYGINAELLGTDVIYGAFPGIIPPAKGGDGVVTLREGMFRTFTKYGILTERIVRGGQHLWGSYDEVSEGLRLGEEMRRKVVFITSSYHLPRLYLVCAEILGFRTMKRRMDWNKLSIVGRGNTHATARDTFTEPVKYVAQLLRIPFGSFMPKTLRGRL